MPEGNPIKFIQITIKYIDGDSPGGNYFFNVQGFVQFMFDEDFVPHALLLGSRKPQINVLKISLPV